MRFNIPQRIPLEKPCFAGLSTSSCKFGEGDRIGGGGRALGGDNAGRASALKSGLVKRANNLRSWLWVFWDIVYCIR